MRTRHALAALAVVLVVSAIPLGARAAPMSKRVLDSFDDITPWKAVASDGVQASIHSAEGKGGRALRLDFDLAGTAGYATARRALPLALPPRYEISFYLRAEAPVNTLQLKLVDASGDRGLGVEHRREVEGGGQRVAHLDLALDDVEHR